VRTRVALAASILVGAAVVAVACGGDLFHNTSFETLCTVDASTKGCPQKPITDLCMDPASALARAEHACAWLAACQTPMGQNRTGQCIANALMAYNCSANPNRKPVADAYQFWLALANANDCEAIAKAVAPAGLQRCNSKTNSAFTGCGTDSTGNPNSRVQCAVADGVAFGAYENCIAYGKTCSATTTNDLSQCLGPAKRQCGITRCEGQKLINCNDAGLDFGMDCSQFGDGTCLSTGAQPACKPTSTNVRAATANVACDNQDIATGSVTGFEEHVDCKVFSGVVDGGAVPGPLCQSIDGGAIGTIPRDACQGPAACTDDSCSGTVLRACVQGNEVKFDCKDVGLNSCNPSVKTQEDGAHAACSL
jgi:hypothetical protein